MPVGGGVSKAGVVGVCGVAGCTASIVVPCIAVAAGVAPTRVLRNCTSPPVMRPIRRRLSRAVGPLALGHLRLEYNDCGERRRRA